MFVTLLVNLIVILGSMLMLWLISLKLRDVSIVDPFWGTGFAIVAFVSWGLNAPTGSREILIVTLVTIWGLRLSGYLLWRNWGHGEDARYAQMRAKHGDRFWWVSLLTVFGLQAVLLWFIAWPVQVVIAARSTAPLGPLDLLGVALWGLGIFFEAVGDWQLARFKMLPENRGKVMDRGLWRYTRHPNYFGDFCVWWGIFLIAAAGGAYWTVASPILMAFLLLRVSGVSLLERSITERRPEYADYQARTNAFFPGPPKRI